MNVYGERLEGYDIHEGTNVGRVLYNVASLPSVLNFLETGTQIGGSARVIGSALKNTSGELHTIEAVQSRVDEARTNLYDLPVECHWMSTKNETGLRGYYNRFVSEIKVADGEFEDLVQSRQWDAAFLDSCSVSQQYELECVIELRVKHIIMHEPDAKCPGFAEYMKNQYYTLEEKGFDDINGHRPMFVYYTTGVSV